MPRSHAPESRRRPSPSAITAVLALSGTLVALMQTLVVPLLPDFPGILGVTADDASWLVTATLLSSAVATPIVSRSADMYGKRKMMVVCLAIMVAGSVLAAVGGAFVWLVIGRALQGFASALIPVGISIMRDELPKEKMGSAVALMSATLGIGSALGLPLAGVLYESLGWASIFWVSAAARDTAAPCRGAGGSGIEGPHARELRLCRRARAVGGASFPAPGDLQGRLLGLGIRAGPAPVPHSGHSVGRLGPYELKVSQPMVDLRTSGRRPVLMTNLASLLIGFAMFANMLLTTQQLQLPTSTGYGFGLEVITAGLCMLPSGIAMVVFAPVSGRIIRVFGGKPALIAGAIVMIVGYVGRVFFYDSIAWVIVGSTVVSVGTAIAYAAMPTLIMGVVPITETASANGLNSLVRSIGTSTSSAAVAAVFTSITMTVGTTRSLSFDAFKDVFWLAALASAASMLAAVFIPRAAAVRRAAAPAAGAVEACGAGARPRCLIAAPSFPPS